MIYELRIYTVVPGRLLDTVDRFRDHVVPLFDRHGIDNRGRWIATAGPKGPCFVYLLAYRSLEKRAEQWACFGNDPDWIAVRDRTAGREELTERSERVLIAPNPAWQFDGDDAGAPAVGIHELILAEVPLGRAARASAYLRDWLLPLVRKAGGRPMMASDMLFGSNLPRIALMIAWDDPAARERGWEAVELDRDHLAQIAEEREVYGRATWGKRDVLLLQPSACRLPPSDLLRA